MGTNIINGVEKTTVDELEVTSGIEIPNGSIDTDQLATDAVTQSKMGLGEFMPVWRAGAGIKSDATGFASFTSYATWKIDQTPGIWQMHGTGAFLAPNEFYQVRKSGTGFINIRLPLGKSTGSFKAFARPASILVNITGENMLPVQISELNSTDYQIASHVFDVDPAAAYYYDNDIVVLFEEYILI